MEASRPATIKMTVEEMTNDIIKEVTVGVNGTGIKCGVIGEVGCTWPLTG